jgi:hypothetical protein
MKPFLIKELEENNYIIQRGEEPVGGTRPRLLLKSKKNSSKFFLKTYAHNSREIFSELLASGLGNLLNLDVQKVSIKIIKGGVRDEFIKLKTLPANWNPIGALVRHAFKKDFDILYGKGVIGEDKERFKLSSIEKAIRTRYYAPDDLLAGFARMIVFDAFIGNMDRHHENWGIAEHKMVKAAQLTMDPSTLKSKREFATLFDHGSSLLFELDEKNVENYLMDIDSFEKNYVLGAKYSFFLNEEGKEDNIFALIEYYITKDPWKKLFTLAIKGMFNKVACLDIAKVLLKMPQHRFIDFSDNRKSLLFESLSRRQCLLMKMV